MTHASDGKRDFFISFTGADQRWACWVARTLAEAGYRFWFQDQDFAGSIPRNIEKAHEQSNRTILLLSDAYAKSGYCRSEWEMRYQEDPGGEQDLLILFRVGPAAPPPLLRRIAYVDLFGCQDEVTGRELVINRLRQAIEPGTKLPIGEIIFPGVETPFPVPQHNLPPFNPDFVGREPVLAELRYLLTSSRGPAVLSQAISGLGGIGKSQTALAYCYRHLANYKLVWWFRAGSAEVLAADFTTLAAPLGLDPAATDQAKLIADIRAALQASADWLLVFDNVEDPQLPRTFLPTTGQGHALITSRRTDWHGIMKARELEVMKEGEALQLLTGCADPNTLPAAERAEAKALAEELGYLPLALAQARAYMTEAGKSFAGYRRLLQASRPAVLDRGRPSPDYPASVAKTWQLSIEAAEDGCAAARPLLELLAFFASDALPVAVLASAPAILPEGLRAELARDEAIGALKRFSLIQAEKDALTVHRLVQAVTRDGLDAATAKAHALRAVGLVNAVLPSPPWEHTNWPAIGTLLPHALATAEAAECFKAGQEAAATVINNMALYHHTRAAYAEAEPLYQRALTIYEKALGSEHSHVATILNNLAELYRETGRSTEAEPLYQRALAIKEKVLGPEHPDVSNSLNNLAALYRDTGRYAEAEPLYQRALAIDEIAFGPEHSDVALRLNNLALLYTDTRRYAEAEPLYQRALAIDEIAFGREHPVFAGDLNNLALLYRATGRLAEAESRHQCALTIREKTLGPEHPDVAISLNNLAEIYQATGRYAEAEPRYQRAIAIWEKSLPPEHPHLIQVRENYAVLLDQLGRPAEAAELRAQTRAIRFEHQP